MMHGDARREIPDPNSVGSEGTFPFDHGIDRYADQVATGFCLTEPLRGLPSVGSVLAPLAGRSVGTCLTSLPFHETRQPFLRGLPPALLGLVDDRLQGRGRSLRELARRLQVPQPGRATLDEPGFAQRDGG